MVSRTRDIVPVPFEYFFLRYIDFFHIVALVGNQTATASAFCVRRIQAEVSNNAER